MSSCINPYEFLGVTINTSTKDLKKRYHELSLKAHPDKGGSQDEMITLHSAYKFVLNELSQVHHLTIEELEEARVHIDIVFENNWMKASLEDGYGDFMDASEQTILDYKSVETEPVNIQFMPVTLYKNHIGELDPNTSSMDIETGGKKNYTATSCAGLSMSDYKLAFTDAQPCAGLPELKEKTMDTVMVIEPTMLDWSNLKF